MKEENKDETVTGGSFELPKEEIKPEAESPNTEVPETSEAQATEVKQPTAEQIAQSFVFLAKKLYPHLRTKVALRIIARQSAKRQIKKSLRNLSREQKRRLIKHTEKTFERFK